MDLDFSSYPLMVDDPSLESERRTVHRELSQLQHIGGREGYASTDPTAPTKAEAVVEHGGNYLAQMAC